MRLNARNATLVTLLLIGLLGLPYVGVSGHPGRQTPAEAYAVVMQPSNYTTAADWTAAKVATDTSTPTPTFTATLTPVATMTSTPTLTPASTSTPVSGPNVVVGIRDFAFRPRTILIAPGTTIVWINRDAAPHTATSDTGVWDTGPLATGQSGFHTFTSPGVFPYHCSIHPTMIGEVVVSSSIRKTYLPAIFKSFRRSP